ncbi:MAG: DNRLRE domain-containing protein [Candidatus Hodarchaeales archaeon]
MVLKIIKPINNKLMIKFIIISAVILFTFTKIPTVGGAGLVSTTSNLVPDRDTYISEESPGTAHGSENFLTMGKINTKLFYTLLYWNLGNYVGISDATLTFATANPTTAFTANIEIIESTWTESVTWNTIPSYSDGPVVSGSCTSDESFCSINIDSIVEAWETSTNYGILLKDDSANYNISFTSREDPSNTSYLQLRLSLTYSSIPEGPVIFVLPFTILFIGLVILLKKEK